MSYDLIIGANGQDGKILSKIYERERKNVILIGRQYKRSKTFKQRYYQFNLENYTQLHHILDEFPIKNTYYFAAEHNTSYKFSEIDDNLAKIINYEAPKYILNFLARKNNLKTFIYASSKLVFIPQDKKFTYNCKRRVDNPYSRWKNEFENFIDNKTFLNSLILIIWFSNHDSKYKKENFLLPRISKELAKQIDQGSGKISKRYNISNDWGDAEEFMEIVFNFVQDNLAAGIHKQFISNNDVCNLDEVINEILNYKHRYPDYLRRFGDSSGNTLNYISQSDLMNSPRVTTREVIWKLVQEELNKKALFL